MFSSHSRGKTEDLKSLIGEHRQLKEQADRVFVHLCQSGSGEILMQGRVNEGMLVPDSADSINQT